LYGIANDAHISLEYEYTKPSAPLQLRPY